MLFQLVTGLWGLVREARDFWVWGEGVGWGIGVVEVPPQPGVKGVVERMRWFLHIKSWPH